MGSSCIYIGSMCRIDAGAPATSAIHHMSQCEEKENIQLDEPENPF
jgi:hypothetical protein